MKISLKHILIIVVASMALSVSCGKKEAKVIPRAKLARIYAEMLVTDQWITSTSGVRQIADTSLVYEPILEKYGYDSEDYRKTIDVYMDDPERFARIMRTTVDILEDRLGELKREQKHLEALAKLPKIKSDFKVEEYVPYWKDEPYVHYYDSLDVVMDSTTRMYRLESIERGDTLYDRIRMIKPAADSVKVDSLETDSLKIDSLKMRQPTLKKVKGVSKLEKHLPAKMDSLIKMEVK